MMTSRLLTRPLRTYAAATGGAAATGSAGVPHHRRLLSQDSRIRGGTNEYCPVLARRGGPRLRALGDRFSLLLRRGREDSEHHPARGRLGSNPVRNRPNLLAQPATPRPNPGIYRASRCPPPLTRRSRVPLSRSVMRQSFRAYRLSSAGAQAIRAPLARSAGTRCPCSEEEIRISSLFNRVSSLFALITHQTESRL